MPCTLRPVTDNDGLVRFGVAMDAPLLRAFDALVKERGGTRSEVLRDLVRAEVTRAEVQAGVPSVATLTVVYDHHVKDLTDRLMELQHSLGDKVRATMHVHLDHDHCLEVTVMNGASDVLREVADRVLATRGVKHGGVEVVALPRLKHTHEHEHDGHVHHHTHEHAHAFAHHTHPHEHVHQAEPAKEEPARPAKRTTAAGGFKIRSKRPRKAR